MTQLPTSNTTHIAKHNNNLHKKETMREGGGGARDATLRRRGSTKEDHAIPPHGTVTCIWKRKNEEEE